MKKQILFLLLVIGVLSGCSKSTAAANSQQDDVSTILTELEKNNKLWSLPLGNDELCWSLFEDMKNKKNIEYILPVDTADKYEKLNLNKFIPNCKNEKYNVNYLYTPTMVEYTKNMTLDKKEKFGIKATTTSNFKLYKENIDGIGGDEIVLYAEKTVSEDQSINPDGGFTIISPRTCEKIGGMQTHDPIDYAKNESLNNKNGFLKYRNKFYSFDLWQTKLIPHLYTLTIYGFSENGKYGSMCYIGKDFRKGTKK